MASKKWKKFGRLGKPALFVIFGAAAGYLFYANVGCVTGSCPITSNPISSVLYGGVIGYLLSSFTLRTRSD